MDPSAKLWEDYRVQRADEKICLIVTPSWDLVVRLLLDITRPS